MFNTLEILDIAITLEKNTERLYNSTIRHIKNFDLKDLLAWAGKEEAKHAEYFSNLRDAVVSDTKNDVVKDLSDDDLGSVLGNTLFSLEDVDFTKISTLKDLLLVFIEFENDTILFYELLQSFLVDEAASEKVDQIINEEKQHIEKLQAFLTDEEHPLFR